jgi:DNA-binding response OmpR family regulator
MPVTMPHVILIEDDALVRTLLARRMESAGWQVTQLKDGRELQVALDQHPAHLLVIDLGLPYLDGLALVEALRARGINTPVLVISAYELPHLHETVRSAGADDLLPKPFDQEELVERMRRLLAA